MHNRGKTCARPRKTLSLIGSVSRFRTIRTLTLVEVRTLRTSSTFKRTNSRPLLTHSGHPARRFGIGKNDFAQHAQEVAARHPRSRVRLSLVTPKKESPAQGRARGASSRSLR